MGSGWIELPLPAELYTISIYIVRHPYLKERISRCRPGAAEGSHWISAEAAAYFVVTTSSARASPLFFRTCQARHPGARAHRGRRVSSLGWMAIQVHVRLRGRDVSVPGRGDDPKAPGPFIAAAGSRAVRAAPRAAHAVAVSAGLRGNSCLAAAPAALPASWHGWAAA